MAKAIWEDATLAESSQTVEIEGNQDVPPDSVKQEFFQPSTHHTTCGWKGEASYYHLDAAGKTNENAAWFYASPKDAAKQIAGYVAFWKGVQVS